MSAAVVSVTTGAAGRSKGAGAAGFSVCASFGLVAKTLSHSEAERGLGLAPKLCPVFARKFFGKEASRRAAAEGSLIDGVPPSVCGRSVAPLSPVSQLLASASEIARLTKLCTCALSRNRTSDFCG